MEMLRNVMEEMLQLMMVRKQKEKKLRKVKVKIRTLSYLQDNYNHLRKLLKSKKISELEMLRKRI